MRKILKTFGILALTAGIGPIYAYVPGAYVNLGLGVSTYSWKDSYWTNNGGLMWKHNHDAELAGRAGIGYLFNVTHSDNPFFAGLEADYNFSRLDDNWNIAGIFGKQLSEHVDIVGKLGPHPDSFSLSGPLVGLGIGYQVSPHVRLVTEVDHTFGQSSHPWNQFSTTSVLESFQFHF